MSVKNQSQKVEGGYELIHYWDAFPSADHVLTVLIDPEGWFVMEESCYSDSPAAGICANIKAIYEEMGWDHD